MFGKKLLTFVCFLGILAWGACFLPPPRRTQPPPPPLAAGLSGIRRICVKVTNQSEAHHTDPAAVGRGIVEAVRDRKKTHSPEAHFGDEASAGDATLQISIVNETANPEPAVQAQSSSTWTFQLTIDASLVNSDGVVVWQESNRLYRFNGGVQGDNSAAAWESPGFADWVRYSVCDRLVSRMLYGFR